MRHTPSCRGRLAAVVATVAAASYGGDALAAREVPAAAAQARAGSVDARIDAFWKWWRTSARRLAAAVDAGKAPSIADELTSRLDAIDPRLAWETGPGRRGARHHLALSSEGDTELRVVTERWLARAPPPDAAWEYYAARQAAGRDALRSLRLEDAGATMEFAEARVAIEPDPARELVHVTFHHPAFAKLAEGARQRAALLMLDQVLGEDGVERWIGGIELSVEPLPEGKPLGALAEAVEAVAKGATGERWVLLQGASEDGRPALATVNVAVKRIDHLLLDHHLTVTMPFAASAAHGMPTTEENEALNALEDELVAALGKDAVHLGHETGDGRRVVHLRVAGEGPAQGRTAAWAKRHAGRTIEIAVERDPRWDVLRRWR